MAELVAFFKYIAGGPGLNKVAHIILAVKMTSIGSIHGHRHTEILFKFQLMQIETVDDVGVSIQAGSPPSSVYLKINEIKNDIRCDIHSVTVLQCGTLR